MPDDHEQRTGADGERPMVSLVMPAYNCAAYVEEAIDSVLAQTYKDLEIIVVNDAATDSTADILRRYEQQGLIRVVTHSVNQGLAAARNSGIRAARGRYVTFLDSDDVWRPEKLEYHMSILQRRPEIALLSNDGMVFQDGEDVVFPPLPETPELRPVNWTQLLFGSCPLSASNAMVRRDALEEVGLFDGRLRAAEDRDLWMRLARRFPAYEASGVVHGYRRHAGNMTGDPTHMKGNMKKLVRKALADAGGGALLRMRAYGHLYLSIAITCYEGRLRWRALEHLLKSFLACPLPLGHAVHKMPLIRCIWAVKMVLGIDLFEKIWGRVRRS